MNFYLAGQTDVGIVKSTNQDSLLVKKITTDYGGMVFAILCDGMGGLAKGELASATVIRAFDEWAQNELPILGQNGHIDDMSLKNQWERIILEQNVKIKNYGMSIGVNIGTTAVILLVTQNRYYLMNVGDSRAYLLSDDIRVLTKDQTLVEREVELGNITREQAEVDPRRSVLLQCVGASENVIPDMFYGDVMPNTAFLLCSDGFRHEITPEEIYANLNPDIILDSNEANSRLRMLITLNMQRNERDNITAALIKVQ